MISMRRIKEIVRERTQVLHKQVRRLDRPVRLEHNIFGRTPCSWFLPSYDAYVWFCEQHGYELDYTKEMYLGNSGGCLMYDNNRIHVLYINPALVDGRAHPPQVAAIVAHECFHLCERIWEWISEKEVGEEIKAYTLDHLVEQVFHLYMESEDLRVKTAADHLDEQHEDTGGKEAA